jgi:hypothetical protein
MGLAKLWAIFFTNLSGHPGNNDFFTWSKINALIGAMGSASTSCGVYTDSLAAC